MYGYEEMGLNNEEEAYLATQLAIYGMVSEIKYNTANIEFSLDNIVPSEEKYEDMVNRVILKAKELYLNALNNPYENQAECNSNYLESSINISDNKAIIGPFYDFTTTDEDTKKILGDSYDPKTQISVDNYIEGSTSKVVDKQGNDVTDIRNGEEYFIEVDNVDIIFSQFKTRSQTYYLSSYIYKSDDSKIQYVIPEADKIAFYTVESIIHNIDSGNVNISFVSDEGEPIEGVKYYIYYDEDVFIQDINGFDYQYKILLPIGKYYIEVYELPDKSFLEESIYNFEITPNGECNIVINMDTLK